MGREDNTISIFVSPILHIPVTETGDLSVSKQNLSELLLFILHSDILLSFVCAAVICYILDIPLKEDSLCITDQSLANFFQEVLTAC